MSFSLSLLFLILHSFIIPNATNVDSPLHAIQNTIQYYIILGFVNVLLYWIAWASWMIAAERQVQRIRLVFIRVERVF